MRFTCRFLCWISAVVFLCSWGGTAGDSTLSPSTPKTVTSAPVVLRGDRRYFANDSYIGRPVPCTRDDKICFRHNLVFHPEQDSCLSVGVLRVVNRTELEQGSGRVVGEFLFFDPCTGYRMAYDGRCYEKEMVEDIICGPEANVTYHPFGGAECRTSPATPITVHQPEEAGSCVIPDLRFPDYSRPGFFNNPFTEIQGFKNDDLFGTLKPNTLECGSDQTACFSKEMVFVSKYEGCHTLLEKGPCAEDHMVALNVQAATQGRAEASCVHERGGCPSGYKRMVFDGECHEDREIALESPASILFNQFGNYIITWHHSLHFSPALSDNICVINISGTDGSGGGIVAGGGESVLNPPCGADDTGKCQYEAENGSEVPEM